MRKTKIVATLGPASWNHATLTALVEAGLDVARFNFSHADYDLMREKAALLRQISKETGRNVALLADTKGPEIRTGIFANGAEELVAGNTFTLTVDECEGTAQKVSVTYKNMPNEVKKGNRILLDDGLIELIVEEVVGNDIVTKIINGGTIKNKKSVNLPDVSLKMDFISEQDARDLAFIVQEGFDFLAASFVRNIEDVNVLKAEIAKHDPACAMKIIAKIENGEGVNNADAILDACDGVMVARGDLGVEVDFDMLPRIQKDLIKQSRKLGKTVITATQMLESMSVNPRPTRAEVSDVANAIYDGTSAIMLSGETAAGKWPVEAVKTMVRIAERVEGDINYIKRFKDDEESSCEIRDAVSHGTVMLAHNLNAAAILSITLSGGTARNVSRFRPVCPIIACTPNPVAYRQMKLEWGVTALLTEEKSDTTALFNQAVTLAVDNGYIKKGDVVVITAGVPVCGRGETNLLKVHVVGEDMVI